MINLKCLSRQMPLLIIILFVPFLGMTQSKLTVKWGIENKGFFQETIATKEQNSAYFPKAKLNDKKYRFVSTTSRYNDVIEIFFERHWKLWDEFKKQSNSDSSQTKLNF